LANCESEQDKVSSYLSKAMTTIDRARALTGQLLTFAKGGAPIQKTGRLFPFIQETTHFALSGSNVSCRFDVQENLWPCSFDKNQIGQVIDNLVINAQQAMPFGGEIVVSARNVTLTEKELPTLPKGNYVKLSVKDSGIGMSKELLPRIFDPFFTTKAMGHGLGLATCYSIVNRHGGAIDVESEPGKGSTFFVYLPASTEAVSFTAEQSSVMHKGSGTFLIMDDEEVIRETVGRMLGSFGYTAVCKEEGRGAIDYFAAQVKEKRALAGIIFDLTVPGGMGGKAAVDEIRKMNREIPVFVASGYADDPVMKNPSEYGFTASICKPFMKSELSEMLNKYLKAKK
jgi:CheY-like chemotaxis protein